MHDFIVAGISVVLTSGVAWVVLKVSQGTGLARLVAEIDRKYSKRLDRVETVIPPIARGMLVILKIHLGQETNGDVKESLDELQKLSTDMMVSQRERT